MDELFRQFGVTSAAAVLTLFFPPKLRPLLEAVTGSKKRFKRQFREEIQRNINRLNIRVLYLQMFTPRVTTPSVTFWLQ